MSQAKELLQADYESSDLISCLPAYLQAGIQQYIMNYDTLHADLYKNELEADINDAWLGKRISTEIADELRCKYLWS